MCSKLNKSHSVFYFFLFGMIKYILPSIANSDVVCNAAKWLQSRCRLKNQLQNATKCAILLHAITIRKDTLL